jgi:feruloyl esterase
VLKPSSDSNINAELWMPSADWNGKFLAVGNGGFGGSIQGYNDMQVALRRGYATAGNDTGHTEADGPNGMFALGHPEKIVDFSHRAMHEMVVTSKRMLPTAMPVLMQSVQSRTKGLLDGRTRQGVTWRQAAFPEDFDGHHRRRSRQSSHQIAPRGVGVAAARAVFDIPTRRFPQRKPRGVESHPERL